MASNDAFWIQLGLCLHLDTSWLVFACPVPPCQSSPNVRLCPSLEGGSRGSGRRETEKGRETDFRTGLTDRAGQDCDHMQTHASCRDVRKRQRKGPRPAYDYTDREEQDDEHKQTYAIYFQATAMFGVTSHTSRLSLPVTSRRTPTSPHLTHRTAAVFRCATDPIRTSPRYSTTRYSTSLNAQVRAATASCPPPNHTSCQDADPSMQQKGACAP